MDKLEKSKSALSYFLMFSIIFLLSLNFTILRSVRNTVAVADLGLGAHTIAFFELFGALPAAVLVTWILAKVMNRFSLKALFIFVLGSFLAFFILFSFVLHPFFVKSGAFVFSMLFYTIAELWKPVLINVLFWGLVNQNIGLEE